ncbi:hypothetical protein GTA08_BOTSDO00862 [Botryosphaeria dothidea]|uniref:Uncharacterized protein n=1 Tax=Botryosphaeria dothidea TaxID=55169 RepID=A0A8H4N8H1_9PEZI|nr:hypothetical protein GTA08_BOTSDO00862 [Botryosphaeria dothidea]
MLRFLTSGLREDPQPQLPDPTQQQQQINPCPEPPRSPRLQVEHARRLEEEIAILRVDLADTRQSYEHKLADQHGKLAAQLASQREKYESKTARLEARNKWLEDTVQQLATEKAWLARRNDALERTEKALDARIGGLEEEVFELKDENAALRQENADYRVDFDEVVGEVAALQKAASAMAERAHKALTRPKAKEGRKEDDAKRTPGGKRIEAPNADLSGETLTRTAPREAEGNEGERRGRPSTNSRASGVDPRSLEALQTLGPSRNVSPSPTPDSRRQRRLGGGGVCAGGGSTVADAASENVTVRTSRKRQRTESDTESGLTA